MEGWRINDEPKDGWKSLWVIMANHDSVISSCSIMVMGRCSNFGLRSIAGELTQVQTMLYEVLYCVKRI